MPTTREVVHFSTNVRVKETKSINIANRTNLQWNLRPSIDGEYYTGSDTFSVEPMSNRPYEVQYLPLTMTTEGKKHQGTLFFPLPDGTGLLYNLSGGADPPKAVSKINRDVPCKTSYTEMLSVTNWLRKPQRLDILEYFKTKHYLTCSYYFF
jgi:hydrocephalus-inducing protein